MQASGIHACKAPTNATVIACASQGTTWLWLHHAPQVWHLLAQYGDTKQLQALVNWVKVMLAQHNKPGSR